MGYKFQDFFIYEVDFSNLANGTSATGTISIDTQSDFIWQKACYSADLAAAAQTDSGRVIPLCTVLLTDSGSSRQLMNSAVPVSAFFGTGYSPFILTSPKTFGARSIINVTVANYSAASTYNLRLSFIGLKAFL